jgi:hypothetical protein
MTRPLLTLDEVATLLRVSKWFVYDHGDELGLVKVGGKNCYQPDRVEAYIASRSAPTPKVTQDASPARRSAGSLTRTSTIPLLPIGAKTRT